MNTVDLAAIGDSLSRYGLILRGRFDFEAEEAPPVEFSARSVLLVGHAGGALWPHFVGWLDRQPDVLAHPLDTWSRGVIEKVAGAFGARAVAPSDKPYLPFQQWAMRSEGIEASPLGILIHPQYGLWHAWRGALLFDRPLGVSAPEKPIHLCDACVSKPCLKGCPVDAFHCGSFDRSACISHVTGEDGAQCREGGCIARNACPYGTEYRYPADMQAYLMRAFAGV